MINKSKYPIGLDISDLSLKFVQLGKSRDKILMQGFSKIDLEKGIIKDGEIKKPEEFISSLKKMIDKPIFGKALSNEAVICLPEEQSFIKLIKVENSKDNLEDGVTEEISKCFPMSLDDTYYDYQIIFEENNVFYILVAACPKDIIDGYIEILRFAKISVIATELESMAISRAILMDENPFHEHKEKNNYVIIDIGASRTSVFAYSKNAILFDISIPLSGDEITLNISKELNLDRDQAELAKITMGLDASFAKGIVKKSLSQMIEKISEGTKEIIAFQESRFEEFGDINKIFLSGGGANIRNINDILEKNIGIPVVVADPFIHIHDPKKQLPDKFLERYRLSIDLGADNPKEVVLIPKNTSVNYTTAIGLALRNLFIE